MLSTKVSTPEAENLGVKSSLKSVWVWTALLVLVGMLFFVSLYNLTEFPTTWFDEGSHLHVPKTLVTYGVYADRSSEGFRYYGPTIGVGPTVMLPLAASFRLFGIGLLQARLVMVVYLIATVLACYWLARQLGSWQMGMVTCLLLVITPAVALLEYGRQVLGEVPAIFFLFAALALWLHSWENASWWRLSAVGLLIGLSIVTKSQFLLIIVPSIGLMWLLNLVYYRTAPQRTFIIPGVIAVLCAILWQAYLVLYLGPATAAENFSILRQASAGAAFVFSPDLIRRSLGQLLSANNFMGAFIPALIYGFWLSLPRRRDNQLWNVLYILMVANLLWYTAASIGWIRYAFLGLAIMCFFVAKFFHDLTGGFQFSGLKRLLPSKQQATATADDVVSATAWVWLVAMLLLPAVPLLHNIIRPGFDAPREMAAYLDQHIPQDAVIETWEPEMGFLSSRTFHFPPAELLDTAVGYIWRNGPPPAKSYDLSALTPQQLPPYILVGAFSRWVNLYPSTLLDAKYEAVTTIGAYQLYKLH